MQFATLDEEHPSQGKTQREGNKEIYGKLGGGNCKENIEYVVNIYSRFSQKKVN